MVHEPSGERKKIAVIDRLGEPVSRIEFYAFLAVLMGVREVVPVAVAWLSA